MARHEYGILNCPVDKRPLKIHKKRAGTYYYCSCVCGYFETALSPEELRSKVREKR
jgi:uncharacterized protein YbaR (Trm112 family)